MTLALSAGIWGQTGYAAAPEAELEKREKENRLKQIASVKKFQQDRIALKLSVDADLAGLSPAAQSQKIEAFQKQLAGLSQKEREAMKPFEEENQKIRAEREKRRTEFIQNINETNRL